MYMLGVYLSTISSAFYTIEPHLMVDKLLKLHVPPDLGPGLSH